MVSSTDAAAVFAVLRGSGLQLKRRVGVTLELESGLNDPVAVILTTALTANLLHAGHRRGSADPVRDPAPARHRRRARRRRRATADAICSSRLQPAGRRALSGAHAGARPCWPSASRRSLHGSGFLAVYLAGLVLGNGPLPYRTGLLRVHDALAWLARSGCS